MRPVIEEVRVVRGVDGLAVVGVYEDVVDHGGDEGEYEYGGDFGPGVLDPCVDAFCEVGR